MEIASSTETGRLGIRHLKRIWSKSRVANGKTAGELASEWNTDRVALYAAGVGIFPAMRYLYHVSPAFSEFENWILENSTGVNPDSIQAFNTVFDEGYRPPKVERDLSVLSEADWQFWETNGYFIIRNAVSRADCAASIAAIEEFLGLSAGDPLTWYDAHPMKSNIMVELFNHPALQKNRESKKIRAVYEQLWGRSDLWASIDRVGFNPPETEFFTFPGPYLHWDVELKLPIPFGLQGILYLSDTQSNQGAFTLVPGFQHRITEWLTGLPAGAEPWQQDLHALGAIPLAANAGDFIVWHQALPHGSSPNTAELPRIVQYLSWSPAT